MNQLTSKNVNAMSNETQSTAVTIGPVRLSYFQGWEPKAAPGSTDLKYSTSLIIPKTDTAMVAKIEAAITAAYQQGVAKFGSAWKPKKAKMARRDGDDPEDSRNGDEAYKGAYFLNANSKDQPGIVGMDRKPVMNQNDVYSGCYAYAAINFFPYNWNGTAGIGCGLQHIMKAKDGEPLSSRISADDAFAGIEAGAAAGSTVGTTDSIFG